MPKTQSVLLGITAFALILAGYLWLELKAERKLARQNQSDVLLIPAAPTTGRTPGSMAEIAIPRDRQQGMLPTELNGNVTAVPAAPGGPADKVHKELISMTFTREGRLSLDLARRTIARLYPDLRTGAGLGDQDVEILTGLMASGAYPEESEKALGASTYRRWMDYRRTKDADYYINNLQKRVPDTPLNEEQARELARVLQDEQQWEDEQSPRQLPEAPDPRSKLEVQQRAVRLQARRHANVVDRARAFLTDKQLEALQNDPYAELRDAFLVAVEVEQAKDPR